MSSGTFMRRDSQPRRQIQIRLLTFIPGWESAGDQCVESRLSALEPEE